MPTVADLFCGAGGAGMGLHRVGFEVVGFDIEPQPNYPFEFHLADALTVDLSGFDAVWASPPCQFATRAAQQWRKIGYEYPNLIRPTREMLKASGLPYIIENVPGAPLVNPIMLNGAFFGLNVKRDRLFECSFPMDQPFLPSQAAGKKMGRPWNAHNGELFYPVGHFSGVAEARVVMDLGWMTRAELTQAIPPAYAQYIGRRMLERVT